MKKLIFLLALVPSLIFANFMVQTVSGKAMFYDGKAWHQIEKKMVLKDDTLVQSYDGSEIRFISEKGNIISIKGNKQFKLQDTITENSMKSKFFSIKSKLLKSDGQNDSSPTAVAGVRGDNVYEQNKTALKRDLYWEQ